MPNFFISRTMLMTGQKLAVALALYCCASSFFPRPSVFHVLNPPLKILVKDSVKLIL